MRALHNHHLKGPRNKIFDRVSVAFNSCNIFLIELTSHYFVIYTSVNTTVCDNSTVQFTFYLFMRLTITIAMRAALFLAFACNAKRFSISTLDAHDQYRIY